MICFEYCGYCAAVFAALENDLVSWDWTLVLTLALFGDPAMSLVNAAAYPAVKQRQQTAVPHRCFRRARYGASARRGGRRSEA